MQHYVTKTYRGTDVYANVFLTSAVVGCEWSTLFPSCPTPGERVPGAHWTEGWMGPKVS
jgi:hypothetical protein